MMQEYLDKEIKKICHIHGISFGSLEDKNTWRIDFYDDCTDEQKKLAINFIDKFEWTDELQKKCDDKYKINQYKDDLCMKQAFIEFKKTNPDALFIDYINYLEKIEI